MKGHSFDPRLRRLSGVAGYGVRTLFAGIVALALLISPMLVVPALAAVTADPGGPYSGDINEKINLNGKNSQSDDADIRYWFWDFGDGSGIRRDNDPKMTHKYQEAGVFTVRLRVVDDDGLSSPWASTTATIIDPNAPPPTVSITQPLSGAIVSGAVPVTAAVSDDSRVSQVEFLVDGTLFAVDKTSPWSTMLETTAVVDGDHTLTAIATDILGRTSQDSIPVTVLNAGPPTVSITFPAEGAVVLGTVTITATASDDTISVEFLVDGESIRNDLQGLNGWSAGWDTATVVDGPHTISAVATNQQGLSSTDSVNVTVENEPVTTTTTSSPTTTTSSTTTTTTTSTTTTTAPTTTTTAATTTTTRPTTTTVTIDATTTTTLEVLGQRIDINTPARGVSAISFEVAPLTLTPGDDITLTFELDALVPGAANVLFLLDGAALGAPAIATTGTQMSFTRKLPTELSVGAHRVELVTEDDPPEVLASRTVSVAAAGAGQVAPPQAITPASTTGSASTLPVVGLLALGAAAAAAVTWRNRRRWLPRRTHT